MNINLVTFTGADDGSNPKNLFKLSKQFPFIEWGILLSQRAEGNKRFPSKEWQNQLCELINQNSITKQSPLNLSGHLCGKWVRDICAGSWEFLNEIPEISRHFQRFQLNFHAYLHKIKDVDLFLEGFQDPRLKNKQFIFQLNDVNDKILDIAQENGINAVGLFDQSGGVGILPDSWPKPRKELCGFAGGLGPDNLKEQLKLIQQQVGNQEIWIDMETLIRNEDDEFDFNKCQQCAEIVLNG